MLLKCQQLPVSVESVVPKQTGVAPTVQSSISTGASAQKGTMSLEIFRISKEKQRQSFFKSAKANHVNNEYFLRPVHTTK